MKAVLAVGKAVHAGYLPAHAPGPLFFPCPPLKIQYLCSEDIVSKYKKSLNWIWLPLDLIPDRKTRQLDYFFILHTFVKLLHFSILQHNTPHPPKKKPNLFTYV